MADLYDVVYRLAVGSDIVRVYAGALVQLYETGTSTLTWEGTADADGQWSVSTLATGIYDVVVDGEIQKTIHFVEADHTHKVDQTWIFEKTGAISADQDEVNTMMVIGSDVAGSIVKITVIAQKCTDTSDVTVHILKGDSDDTTETALTVASDSAWSHRIYPQDAQNRYMYSDTNPGISLTAGEVITLGIDYAATGCAGLTVLVTFRES